MNDLTVVEQPKPLKKPRKKYMELYLKSQEELADVKHENEILKRFVDELSGDLKRLAAEANESYWAKLKRFLFA